MTLEIAQTQLSKLTREREQMRAEIIEREAALQVHAVQIAALESLIRDEETDARLAAPAPQAGS